ncbi:MAG: DUF2017 family protein [Actinomycetota bacterium]
MPRRWFNRPVVERTDQGYVVRLGEQDISLLLRLLAELRGLLQSDDPQVAPLVRRLFPPAYHLDDEADAEYQRYMREELMTSRLGGMDAVTDALRAGRPLTDGEITGFMQSLNNVRLVLGTLLDVGEDHDPTDVDDDHPMVAEHQLYNYTSWLLEVTVHAISGD